MFMLRQGKPADIGQIHTLIQWGAEHGKVLPRSKKEIGEVIDCFWLWEVHGEIIGCVSLEIYNQKLAEIRSLVVRSSHQGQGIGRALVAACVAKAREEKIYEVLSVTDKDKFFEKLGFAKVLNNQWPMFIKP